MSASQERHLDDPTYADRLHRTRATRRSGRPRSGGTGTFWAADMGGSGRESTAGAPRNRHSERSDRRRRVGLESGIRKRRQTTQWCYRPSGGGAVPEELPGFRSFVGVQPQRMVRVQRARRPTGVYEVVVEAFLDDFNQHLQCCARVRSRQGLVGRRHPVEDMSQRLVAIASQSSHEVAD